MRQIFSVALISALVNAVQVNQVQFAAELSRESNSTKPVRYQNYLATHNKNYSDISELMNHFVEWNEADSIIQKINLETERTGEGALVGHNVTSDMTPEEFAKLATGRSYTRPDISVALPAIDQDQMYNLRGFTFSPVNHVQIGFTTPVRDQGTCGSCWAFASTTTLEGALALQRNQPGSAVRISEQEAVDCSFSSEQNLLTFGKDYENIGCYGGLEYNLWDFQRDWGAMAESDYPYTGAPDQPCQRSANQKQLLVPKGKVTGWAREARSVVSLMTRIVTTPFAIGVDATCLAYRFYKAGIITYEQCPGNGKMNHSNAVVGYVAGNETCTIDKGWACDEVAEGDAFYWLVQNSWGTGWGEKGYSRFEMVDNFGVACMNCDATYPTLAPDVAPNSQQDVTKSNEPKELKEPKEPKVKKLKSNTDSNLV